MAVALLKPNDRYAFVGKTRSGKTAQAMVLAGSFARALPPPWEVWWVDTKLDPDDLKALRKWGFRNASSVRDRTESGGLVNALYFRVEPKSDSEDSVVEQAQEIFQAAYRRKHVLVVVDEYVHVCYSARSAGASLLDIFQRGGGRQVGLIGLTQEPVYVPRQLISQATHVCLFSLTYQNDIKYVRNICPIYTPPISVGDPYGFYWSWVDGHADWDYYKDQRTWYDQLEIAKPRPKEPEDAHAH